MNIKVCASSPPKLHALKTVWMTDCIQYSVSNLQHVRNCNKSLVWRQTYSEWI